jgi:aryl-alcohol dehydrogenase-like predicted oxidoreductase
MGMINKICLGTAQFGMDYGIANKKGKPTQDDAHAMLDYAYKNGIDFIDTANTYGDSEKVIGGYIEKTKNRLNIITKISVTDTPEVFSIKDKAFESFARLESDHIYAVLIHNFSGFLKNTNTWQELVEIKDQARTEKIGFSLYLPSELEWLFKNKIIPDIVQVPYSIMDRRFEPYFEMSRDLGIEIHVRSVFLQGLVYLNPDELVGNLETAQNSIKKLQAISHSSDLSVNALCLNYVLLNSLINKLVIGVDSLEQLQDNLSHINILDHVATIKSELDTLSIEDENILLPYEWKNQDTR